MTPADALRWAVRRAEEAEDRAERWIGWGRPAERAEETATHAVAVERVRVLREVCDLLGIEQPPARVRHQERRLARPCSTRPEREEAPPG